MPNEAVFHYGVLVSRTTTGHQPNLKRRNARKWLMGHPVGSTERQVWQEAKALRERFYELLRNEE